MHTRLDPDWPVHATMLLLYNILDSLVFYKVNKIANDVNLALLTGSSK